MQELPEVKRILDDWQQAGQMVNVDNVEIYYQRRGKPGAPILVCFHGFPTCSWDWHQILPLLEQHFDVLIFDFPGYGLSGKPPERDYSLLRQMDAVEALLAYLDIREFELLSHDMGNSVACEMLHRIQQGCCKLKIQRWNMLNGGVYMDMAKPLFTQRLLRNRFLGPLFARLASYRVFKAQFPRTYAHPERFDDLHFRIHWALMQANNGRRVMAAIAVYMRERLHYIDRWQGALHQSDTPLQLLWAQNDPVAIPAIGRQLHENVGTSLLYEIPDCGHYPQLEATNEVASRVVLKWD